VLIKVKKNPEPHNGVLTEKGGGNPGSHLVVRFYLNINCFSTSLLSAGKDKKGSRCPGITVFEFVVFANNLHCFILVADSLYVFGFIKGFGALFEFTIYGAAFVDFLDVTHIVVFF